MLRAVLRQWHSVFGCVLGGKMKKSDLLIVGALVVAASVAAQKDGHTDLWVRIDTIVLEGNYRTRAELILRELEFQAGDTLSLTDLAETLERNRLRVMNTGLFAHSTIHLEVLEPSGHLAVRLWLKEIWYVYPIPVFELADRNFNVWWTDFNRSLKRVNYGISSAHLNLSGWADVLKINLNFGYTNRYEASYERPWFNRSQTLGFRAAVGFSRNREVQYVTRENRQQFIADPEQWMRQRLYAHLALYWRPKLLTTHTFALEYHHNQTSDTVARQLNPHFFGSSRTKQRHVSALYRFVADLRDARPYPLKGWMLALELRQNGLLPSDDLHLFRLAAEGRYYRPLGRRWSAELVLKGRLSWPRRQPPFYNNQALGYGSDVVRGYEFFVVDGLDFFVQKGSLRFLLFDKYLYLGKWFPMANHLPIRAFFALHHDTGYARDPFFAADNPLNNRLLRGYGLGLNVVAFYNAVARFEYSWRSTGGSGFYVNYFAGF